MAWGDQAQGLTNTYKAASGMSARTIVKAAGGSLPNSVIQIQATTTDRPLGAVGDIASIPQGQNTAVFEEGCVVKAIAGASLGSGSEVGFATLGLASGAQGTQYQATVVQLGPVVGASGVGVWAVGISRSNAAAGEIFSLEIRTRQISGLV